MSKNRIGGLVPVQFYQEDMRGFESTLDYPVAEFFGRTLFTDRVLFGEVWIAERTSRKTRWTGHIRDGNLYLDQTIRRKDFVSTGPVNDANPAMLPVGKYKIWLDAWVRRSDFPDVYAGDAPFTLDDTYSGLAADLWSAPAKLPDRKYWQDIEVKPEGKSGDHHRIYVRSRRFHHVYRISRLIEALHQLLAPHEHTVARVATTREYADYLVNFLVVMMNSGTNMARIWTYHQEQYLGLKNTALGVSRLCRNFINFGAGGDKSIVRLRQHINNIATLLWNLINDEGFQREVTFHHFGFAQEHRVILSRLGDIFNRIPVAFSGTSPHEHDTNLVYAIGVSRPFGRMFAESFSLPYYNMKAKSYGHPPPFKFNKPSSTIEWLNSTRRYGISMLNAASIFIVQKEFDVDKFTALYDTQLRIMSEYHQVQLKASIFVEDVNKFIDKAREAGSVARETKWQGVKDSLINERRSINPKLDGALKELEGEMENVKKKISDVQTREPEKFTDALKREVPVALYGVEAFEVYVKWGVMKAAWHEFEDSAGKPREESVKKLADATLKTLDLMGTVLKATAIEGLLSAGWRNRVVFGLTAKQGTDLIGRWGKGLGAAADIGSWAITSYDVFYSNTMRDDLLDRYPPNDAVAIYGWHLVIWQGKELVAIGSSGGVTSKNPFFVKLQALGYLFQFAGEFGKALSTYGKAEKDQFEDALANMRTWANIAQASARNNGWVLDLYSDATHDRMKEWVRDFEWRPIDAEVYHSVFGPLNAGGGSRESLK